MVLNNESLKLPSLKNKLDMVAERMKQKKDKKRALSEDTLKQVRQVAEKRYQEDEE